MSRLCNISRCLVFEAVLAGASAISVGCSGNAGSSDPPADSRVAIGAPAATANGAEENYLVVPIGTTMHKSCVHAIPAGGRLLRNHDIVVGDRVVEHVEPCAYPPKAGSAVGGAAPPPAPPRVSGLYGWPASVQVASAEDAYGYDWFNGMDVGFSVPAKPTNTTGDSYHITIWPALSPADGFYVLQPVLSFGLSGSYGNFNTWFMADWYCDQNYGSGTCFYGDTAMSVNVGDYIDTWVGIDTTQTCDSSGCSFVIGYTVNNGPQVSLPVQITELPQLAYIGVLETYAVTSCSQLPNVSGMWFLNNGLYQPTTDPYTLGWITPSAYAHREKSTATPTASSNGFNGDCAFTAVPASFSGGGYAVDGLLGWNVNM
jgi:hypothetical protein